MIYLEKKLKEVRAKGEGILSISLAPDGSHDFTDLISSTEYLLEAGMNQLLLISYIPDVMVLSDLAPAEQEAVLIGQANGSYREMVFDNLEAVHGKYPDLPLIVTPMLGDMIGYGMRRFVKRAAECGVSGWDTANYRAIEDLAGCRKMVEEEGMGFICAITTNGIDLSRKEHRELIRETVKRSTGEIFLVPAQPGSTNGISGEYARPYVELIRETQEEMGHRCPIIGIGGITDASDAAELVHTAGVDGVHFSTAYLKKKFAGTPTEEIKNWLFEIKRAMAEK